MPVSEARNQATHPDRSPSNDDAGLPTVVVDRGRAEPQRAGPRGGKLLRGLAIAGVLAAAVAVGGIIGLYRQPPGLQWVMQTLGLEPGAGTSAPIAVPAGKPVAEVGSSPSPGNGIVALGRLLPKSEVVTVAPSSGVRDARIAGLTVSEGDQVKARHVIAVLDSEPRFKAAVTAAEATVALREASLIQTRSSVEASRAETTAAVARAEAARRKAEQDFERSRGLVKDGAVSKATHDERTAARDEAVREVERLTATLSRYRADEHAVQPDILVARRSLEAAKAELQRAQEDLEQAYVRAPFDATVLEIHARPGEKPGDKGVVSLGDTRAMVAKIEVYQSQIGQVSIGSRVTLSAPALSQSLSGRVSRIGLQVKKQSVIDGDPAANTDARVIEVIADLDPASTEIAARFTNLQVEARIATGPKP